MKTLFINCSPKKSFSASSWFLAMLRLFTAGKKVSEKLRTPADHARILEQLRGADAVGIALDRVRDPADLQPVRSGRAVREWRELLGALVERAHERVHELAQHLLGEPEGGHQMVLDIG